MATAAQNIRDNQARAIQQQIAASNFGGEQVPEVANGIPLSNDAALSASIEEWKITDVAYQRAQNEEQRQQLENAYTATNRRLHDAKQAIKERSALETEQRNYADASEGEMLALQMQTLTDTFPPNWTPETLPMDKLRALGDLRQKVQNLAAVTGAQGLDPGVLESGGPLAPANALGQQVRPTAFPDGSLYQLKNLPDGQMEVQLVTGERFVGDPITVTQRMAEAQVNTKLWARQKVAEAQQAPPMQFDQQPAMQTTEQSTIADYWADQQAQALGFSNKAEMMQWGEQMTAFKQEYENNRLVTQFDRLCPDFPGTEQASNALVGIVDQNGWEFTPENLQAAHALAVRNHIYEPLSAEAMQASHGNVPQVSRPTAPPMLRTNNPEITASTSDPYNMPMDQLRKQAIRQQLDGSGPTYR